MGNTVGKDIGQTSNGSFKNDPQWKEIDKDELQVLGRRLIPEQNTGFLAETPATCDVIIKAAPQIQTGFTGSKNSKETSKGRQQGPSWVSNRNPREGFPTLVTI